MLSGWPLLLVGGVDATHGLAHVAQLQDRVLVIFVGRRIVVALNNLHDEWNKSVDEDVSAVIVLTPLLE